MPGRANQGARRGACVGTHKERNAEWRALACLPFGLPSQGAVCGVARACKAKALLRTDALHPAPWLDNAIPANSVNGP
jgi:hypothetical protein